MNIAETRSSAAEASVSPANRPKPVLLAVSFGTSYPESRRLTIGAVEAALQEAYPAYELRRAFTSQIIIDLLKERDGLHIDSVTEAMDRLVADGVREVLVQPTHVMEGFEYNDVRREIAAYADRFDRLTLGRGLLASEADYDAVLDTLVSETRAYAAEDTAIVWMGHGTEHSANATYAKLQEKIHAAEIRNMFVGTVEATPTLEDVIDLSRRAGVKNVVLLPLMIVAGDHATNDMAGDAASSWKTGFQAAGFHVTCVLAGLGQYAAIRRLLIRHASEASAVSPSDALPSDGTYAVRVESSSPMFRLSGCSLTVADGKMTAVVSLIGSAYGKVFPGTAAEAAEADRSRLIPVVPAAIGHSAFTFPVSALETPLPCAAWSRKREQWYDRTLVFHAAPAKEPTL